jgi:hypothetical protein
MKVSLGDVVGAHDAADVPEVVVRVVGAVPGDVGTGGLRNPIELSVPKGTYLAGIVSMSGKMSESLDRIELRA